MISVNIYVFVLALSVVALGALAWITFDTRKQLRDVHSSCGTTAKSATLLCNALGERMKKLEAQSPVTLGAQVVELSEAVDRLRKTQQRFAGRIDQQLSDRRERDPVDDEPTDNPTYNALLRAQNTNPFQR